jgi:hypothetical protein
MYWEIHILAILFGRLPAYIDPGSGSFLLQILLAFLFGSLFLMKGFWKRIVGMFRRKPSPTDDPDDK